MAIDWVQLFLNGGAEMNIPDQNGLTPLHCAAWKGHKDVVLLLLDGGAELNIVTHTGETLLHFATHERHKDVVQW